MKILQLRTTGASPFELQLHPQITVVRGLTGSLRLAVVDAFEDIAAGRSLAVEGLVEAHGVHLDLEAAMLRVVLGLGAENFSPVVRIGDVPWRDEQAVAAQGRPDAAAARAQLSETVAEVGRALADAEQRREDLAARVRRLLDMLVNPPEPDPDEVRRRTAAAEAVARAEHEVEEASSALERAAGVLEAYRTDPQRAVRVAAARTRHARAADALARTVAALESARSGIDPGAPEALRVALHRIVTLQEEHAADPAVQEWSDPALDEHADEDGLGPAEPELPDRREASPSQVVEVRAALASASALGRPRRRRPPSAWPIGGPVPPGSTRPPRRALPGRGPCPSRWRRLASGCSGRQPRWPPSKRREPAALDPVAVREVKAAHAALLDARERSEKRRAPGRPGRLERLVEEAAERERELLAALGFETYAEFAISASGPRQAGSESRVRTAQVNLEQAQRELDALTARLEGQRAPASAESPKLARLRAEAIDLLGFDPGPKVDQVLRKPPPDQIPEFVRLMAALDSVGVSTGGVNLDLTGWCELARRWLEEPAPSRTSAPSTPGRRSGSPTPRLRGKDVDRARQRAQDRLRRLQELRSEVPSLQVRALVHGDAVARVADLELAHLSHKAHERITADAVRALELEHGRRDAQLAGVIEAAQERLAAARRQLDSAIAARLALGEPVTSELIGAELIETQRAVMSAAAETARLQERRSALEADLAQLDRQVEEDPCQETTELDRRRRKKDDRASLLEALEWYVLGRLAAQRSASIAGALPLLLDDPFPNLPKGMVRELLDWLERMAAAVQVVILTEDLEAAAWVSGLGEGRGALVHADSPEP